MGCLCSKSTPEKSLRRISSTIDTTDDDSFPVSRTISAVLPDFHVFLRSLKTVSQIDSFRNYELLFRATNDGFSLKSLRRRIEDYLDDTLIITIEYKTAKKSSQADLNQISPRRKSTVITVLPRRSVHVFPYGRLPVESFDYTNVVKWIDGGFYLGEVLFIDGDLHRISGKAGSGRIIDLEVFTPKKVERTPPRLSIEQQSIHFPRNQQISSSLLVSN
jgi:hypothetical protein